MKFVQVKPIHSYFYRTMSYSKNSIFRASPTLGSRAYIFLFRYFETGLAPGFWRFFKMAIIRSKVKWSCLKRTPKVILKQHATDELTQSEGTQFGLEWDVYSLIGFVLFVEQVIAFIIFFLVPSFILLKLLRVEGGASTGVPPRATVV